MSSELRLSQAPTIPKAERNAEELPSSAIVDHMDCAMKTSGLDSDAEVKSDVPGAELSADALLNAALRNSSRQGQSESKNENESENEGDGEGESEGVRGKVPPKDRIEVAPLESQLKIGDFRIEKRIGAGGMGVVYKAREIATNRVVALKVLGAALNRPSDILRFRREARLISRLNHKSIAKVYYVGQDDQLCFMVMEFIEGVSLRRVIDVMAMPRLEPLTLDDVPRREGLGGMAIPRRFDEGESGEVEAFNEDLAKSEDTGQSVSESQTPTTPNSERLRLVANLNHVRRCCEAIRDAARALNHAHNRGVVHRDIKPGNLLLDRTGQIHLIDFGIARFHEDPTITHTGQLVGTPMYMSPEQVGGQFEVDHRTDIYSLGMVLYELLSLKRPILAPSREEIMRRIMTKAMLPISQLNPAVPSELEGVIHMAIDRDPDERYQSAGEFADDLQNWLDSRPVKARRYQYRFDDRAIRNERPESMVFVAYDFYVISVCCLLLLFSYVKSGPRIVNPQVRLAGYLVAPSPQVSMTLLVFFTLSAFFLGSFLLAGRESARKFSLAFLIVTVTITSSLGLQWSRLAYPLEVIYLILSSLILISSLYALAQLTHPRIRSWFRFAERMREEYDSARRGDFSL